MKKIGRDIEMEQRRLVNKKKKGAHTNEQVVVEFSQRLEKKGMTPEGFFRICDSDYSKKIHVETFRQNIITFKLSLT